MLLLVSLVVSVLALAVSVWSLVTRRRIAGVAVRPDPSGTTIGWRIERVNTGHFAAGTMTTNLPTSTQLLAPQLWRGNGTTAAAVGLDVVSVYMETDN